MAPAGMNPPRQACLGGTGCATHKAFWKGSADTRPHMTTMVDQPSSEGVHR